MNNSSNARFKESKNLERDTKHKHKDMFRGSSAKLYVLVLTAWRIFTISTKELPKGYKPNSLHKRRYKVKAQVLYTKQVTSVQEGRHKVKAQKNKIFFTTLGDHKDHKKHMSQYKILELVFLQEVFTIIDSSSFKASASTKSSPEELALSSIWVSEFTSRESFP